MHPSMPARDVRQLIAFAHAHVLRRNQLCECRHWHRFHLAGELLTCSHTCNGAHTLQKARLPQYRSSRWTYFCPFPSIPSIIEHARAGRAAHARANRQCALRHVARCADHAGSGRPRLLGQQRLRADRSCRVAACYGRADQYGAGESDSCSGNTQNAGGQWRDRSAARPKSTMHSSSRKSPNG